MPVEKDPSGRRHVQAEVEVPGTPEEVWAAIATGPGISSWFVPAEVDGRVGGQVVCHFSPDGTMDSQATITAWEPPHRFAADSRDDMGPGDPTVGTEWIVEARAGGTCVVRVVHSWFAADDSWDDQFDGHTHGWRSFFRVLAAYLTGFPGRTGTSFQVMGAAPEPVDAAWAALTGPLGLSAARAGQRVDAPAGLPPLGGEVIWAGPPARPEDLLVRLDVPTAGLVHLVAHPMMGQVFLTARFYLYGDAAAAAPAEAAWRAWMAATFPAPGVPAA